MKSSSGWIWSRIRELSPKFKRAVELGLIFHHHCSRNLPVHCVDMNGTSPTSPGPRKRDIFLKPFRWLKRTSRLRGSPSLRSPRSRQDEHLQTVEPPDLPNIIGLESIYPGAQATKLEDLQANSLPGIGTTIYEGVKTTLQTVADIGEGFPPLKGTAQGLLAICNAIDGYKENHDEFKRLLERVNALSRIMVSCPRDAIDISPEVKGRFSGLAQAIEQHRQTLEGKLDPTRSKAERVFLHPQDRQAVAKITQEIRFAVEISMFEVTMENGVRILQAVKGVDWLKEELNVLLDDNVRSMGNIEQKVNRLIRSELLKRLGEVVGAEFNNATRGTGCIAGTRISLLAKMHSWAEDDTSPPLYWLSGAAGTGKSTVSRTFCAQLDERGALGATHFCSLQDKDQRDVYLIIPTLARILAETRPQFGDALEKILESDKTCRNPTQMTPHDQYLKLIIWPAKEMFKSSGHGLLVLCVDALDECEDKEAIGLFLDAVLRQEAQIPVKLLLTSRPEVHLRERFEVSPHHQCFRLHEIERHIVEADITLYLTARLKGVRDIYKAYEKSWPPPQISIISQYCQGLFIVASTVFKYLDTFGGDSLARFEDFAGGSPDLKLQGIDSLYNRILSEAYSGLEAKEAGLIHSCLSILVSAEIPLSVQDYAQLLQRDTRTIRQAFKSLHSVVEVPSSRESRDDNDRGTVNVFHASFVDHLTSKEHRMERWSIDHISAHSAMADLCLSLMDSMLHFGISGAQTSYRLNTDQPTPLRLSPVLDYACRTWLSHTLHAGVPELLQQKMLLFIEGPKLLYWIEALSVARLAANTGYTALGGVITSLEHFSKMHLPDLQRLADDLAVFLRDFYHPISQSVPHLYLSALPFFAAAGTPSTISFPNYPSTPVVHHHLKRKRDAVTFYCSSGMGLECFAFTFCGNYIRSVHSDGAVRFWNARTGDRTGSLPSVGARRNRSSRNLATISSDLETIAQCIGNMAFLSNAYTGELVVSLGHDGPLYAIALSPIRRQVAVSASDCSLLVRNWTLDGPGGGIMVVGHSAPIYSLAFSPNGDFLACGLCDGNVVLWEVGTNFIRKPLTPVLVGHSDLVTWVTFSPDSRSIAACSFDKTIRVWDVQSGDSVLTPLEGHTNAVSCIAYSPDGTHIASTARDMTTRIWDAKTGRQIYAPLRREQCSNMLLFSPDSSHLLVGATGDCNFHLWDLHSQHRETDTAEFHTSSVYAVAFSQPAGDSIASMTANGTARLWDMHTGLPASKPLDVHSHAPLLACSRAGLRRALESQEELPALGSLVRSITQGDITIVADFSPDGKYILSLSNTGLLRLWDVQTFSLISEVACGLPFAESWSFSVDGETIACATSSGNIELWKIRSREDSPKVLVGHAPTVTSTAFSSDGKLLVSAAQDRSIRIWDVEKGDQLFRPLVGHADGVQSAVFSPDGKFVISGSHDKTMGLWSAQNGELISLVRGHVDSVLSVAFSPDGEHIASGSSDNSLRVWKTSGLFPIPGRELDASKKYPFLNDYPSGSLVLNDDGWIKNLAGDLLLWVPSKFRDTLFFHPALVHIITDGSTRVELSNAAYHGEEWRKDVAPEGEGKPWPIPADRAHFYHDPDSPLVQFFDMAEGHYNEEITPDSEE
ncbi:hypothetical protein D9611_011149 [Ephemerocybe angulata]|uniref:Nephrocystin 3-like N-terminal domain-containing protein n=1 Tax=Ephemerocybe angulata TaxID=980116 RepID=A0A8H5CCG5_9AGAR|nr:hypothetical protein D9611_011149 [Tulosesus angulatus]